MFLHHSTRIVQSYLCAIQNRGDNVATDKLSHIYSYLIPYLPSHGGFVNQLLNHYKANY